MSVAVWSTTAIFRLQESLLVDNKAQELVSLKISIVQETRVKGCHKLVFAKCNAQVLPQSKTSVFPHTRLSSHCSALSATFSFSKEQYQVRC